MKPYCILLFGAAIVASLVYCSVQFGFPPLVVSVIGGAIVLFEFKEALRVETRARRDDRRMLRRYRYSSKLR